MIQYNSDGVVPESETTGEWYVSLVSTVEDTPEKPPLSETDPEDSLVLTSASRATSAPRRICLWIRLSRPMSTTAVHANSESSTGKNTLQAVGEPTPKGRPSETNNQAQGARLLT
jgi:hypothetical protein